MKKRNAKPTSLYLLTVSGSPDPRSQSSRLLNSFRFLSTVKVIPSVDIATLPLYQPAKDRAPWPTPILTWRKQWADAVAVVISTPAYLDNLPGPLKNALDWLATSGEAGGKSVLPITFPPSLPRGKHVMQSLLWSLQALGARVPASLPLAQPDLNFTDNGDIVAGENRDFLVAALELLC
ncbi:NADPH-dependent FMN reductase [Neolewinella xylanilytica]